MDKEIFITQDTAEITQNHNSAPLQCDTPASTCSDINTPTPRAIAPFWLAAPPLILLLAVAMVACRPLTGGIDFWAHAAIGRWIWEHGRVPSETLFLWGRAPIPWVAHSWGAQLVFGSVMLLGDAGPRVAIALTMALSVTAWLPLWGFWRRQNARFLNHLAPQNTRLVFQVITTLILTMAIFASVPRFKPRPELFSAIFLSLLLVIALRRREMADENASASTCAIACRSAASWEVWCLVPLFAIWANVHGAWAFGAVVLAIVVLCDGVQFRGDAIWRRWLLVSLCCVGVTLLNPYGVGLWHALQSVRSSTFRSIEEWKSPWQSPLLPVNLFVTESALLMAAAMMWIGNPRRVYSDMMWLFFGYASFLDARRNLWFLALLCVAVWLNNAPSALRVSARQSSWSWLWQRASSRVWLIGAMWAASSWMLLVSTPHDILTMHAVHSNTPVRMMRWLRAHPAPGHLFNDYEWSSYEQWALRGHPPLYIDLLNAYPDTLMKEYFDVLAMNPRGLQVLVQVQTVVLRPARPSEQLRRFQRYLDAHPQTWRRVYKGADGQIWRRVATAKKRDGTT